MWMYFIGLTLTRHLTEEEKKELADKYITVIDRNVFYQNRFFVSSKKAGNAEIITKIQMTDCELHHFIGQLKRVQSDSIYQAFNDDFGFHCIEDD